MLHKQMELYVAELVKTITKEPTESGTILEMFKEEKEYAETHNLLPSEFKSKLSVKDSGSRFLDAYIERGDKETESFIGNESPDFLNEPLAYFKQHKNEFLYLESKWFEVIGVDAISLEADDVFGTYDVMLGLKLQKKVDKVLKNCLNALVQGDGASYDVLFNGEDGLWNVNFALNNVDGFTEEMSIRDAYELIYSLLFTLVEKVEEEIKG
ncbi:MAG: branched-chain amino acid aminotransferase [Bacillota bacterium]|nr:branched-chain amino acid aminotransferase [Bacillota bacterium]